jgi:hypothetical protein
MDEKQVELLIAAAIGAFLGIATGYALTLEPNGSRYLSGRSLAQSLLVGRSIVIGLFAS